MFNLNSFQINILGLIGFSILVVITYAFIFQRQTKKMEKKALAAKQNQADKN